MTYHIEDRSDLSGAALAIRFPEEQLDRKALYTLQKELPEFLVPFHIRNVDGQIECVYQPESRSKLRYFLGSRSPEEYVKFWEHILTPLLDCGDWFCKPSSFVLDAQYLYIDKNSGVVSYLYAPSRESCMEPEALRDMAVELSHQVTVTDQALENQALRALMQDFQPKEFLQMLRRSVVRKEAVVSPPPREVPLPNVNVSPPQKETAEPHQSDALPPVRGVDDIVINLDGGTQKRDKEKGRGLFGGRGKKEKKKPAKKGGIFGKKEDKQDEIVLGAGAELPPTPAPGSQSAPVYFPMELEDDATQLDMDVQGTCLRLTGAVALPGMIPVKLVPGGTFTIGRFDVSVGHQQSDFEFEKGTKTVSRRHAEIARMTDGSYRLSDIGSSAGTFLNGERLVKDVPRPLNPGDRVSFGTAGANYIWEE